MLSACPVWLGQPVFGIGSQVDSDLELQAKTRQPWQNQRCWKFRVGTQEDFFFGLLVKITPKSLQWLALGCGITGDVYFPKKKTRGLSAMSKYQ